MSIHRFHFENLLAAKYSHWLNHSKYLLVVTHLVQASQVALVVKKPPTNAGEVRNAGSVPGLGRSPGLGHNNPFQSSCLEKPMDRGAWWATVHRVTKRQHTHTSSKWAILSIFSKFSCFRKVIFCFVEFEKPWL